MVDKELTDKQKRFAQEYIIDLNATQAAIRAGYADGKSAEVTGHRLLRINKIREEIRKQQAEAAERLHVTQDWVILRLKDISDRCTQAEPVMFFNRATGEWEKTGEYKFDSGGANRSTELIGKHMGMFVERSEVAHTVSIEQALKDLDEE